jgi:hypothetical protein
MNTIQVGTKQKTLQKFVHIAWELFRLLQLTTLASTLKFKTSRFHDHLYNIYIKKILVIVYDKLCLYNQLTIF